MKTDQEYIALARERFGSTEIQFDDDADVARGYNKGVFVQAWVWVQLDEGDGHEND